uniref:Uncharacterized protein n=1 Tax=Anguilla anguilla TaxID=7936 RepID=A0A0E9R5Y7_ANGAN
MEIHWGSHSNSKKKKTIAFGLFVEPA